MIFSLQVIFDKLAYDVAREGRGQVSRGGGVKEGKRKGRELERGDEGN